MIRRRVVLGSALALFGPLWRAQGQAPKVPLVGIVFALPLPHAFKDAFQQGLREAGYVEGRNILVEYRTTGGRPELFAALAKELVSLPVDVLVAGGGGPGVRAAMNATRTIPIVIPASTDPVREGWAQTLARPGGNATGFSIVETEINAKRLEVLKEMLPAVRRVAILNDPKAGNADDQIRALEKAARTMNVQVPAFRASDARELDAVFQAIRAAKCDALVVTASSTFNAHRERLIALAHEQRMPTLWEHRGFSVVGGLISYGPDIGELYRSSARLVDKILKGAKPAELPVEQASKLELVVNLKTAKAQGVAIPPALLVRADQIIQ